jgi:predicted AlkP superfamily phosphohydrolase/phosphomutase
MTLRALLTVLLAASLLAADLVLLTLFLNPAASLAADGRALLLSLFLPYAAAGAVALALVLLVAGTLRRWPRTPGPLLEGLPWFTSLVFVVQVAAAAIYWHNLLSYRHSIPLEHVRGLAGACVGLTASALVLLAVGVDALLFPRRPRGASAALVVLAYASALVVPLALRPGASTPQRLVPAATAADRPPRRLILMGMDGLGPELLGMGMAGGSAPAFARLMKRGASGPLATLRPTEGPPLWTTIVTGRLPRDHGIKSFATYRLKGSDGVFELLPKGARVGWLEAAGLAATSPVTSASRKRRALWEILNAFGVATGVVRLWATYPPERVQGFVVSEYFHLLRDDPVRAAGTLYPRDLLAEAASRAVEPGDLPPTLVAQFVDQHVEIPGDRVPWREELLERALAPDLSYERAGEVLRAAYDPPFFATYFYGLDVVGHAFLRFAQPDRFGDVSPLEVRRYGKVVERYAAYLGQVAASAAERLRPGEVLLIVSAYGMEPVPFWRRLLKGLGGSPERSGTHAAAPDGVLLAVGDGIRPGAKLAGASVLDVAPTILYLMGLPVARDMEGRVMTEILDEDFARSHPVSVIPSYEGLAVTPAAGPPEVELPPLPDEGD